MHPLHRFVTALARARIVTILCAAALFSGSLPAVAQTGLAPRPPVEKRSLEKLRQMPGSQQVVVKFNEGIKVRLNKAGRLSGLRHPTALVALNAQNPDFDRLPAKRPDQWQYRPPALHQGRGAPYQAKACFDLQ